MDGKEKETLGDLLIEGLPEGSYLQKRLKLWKDLTGYAQEFPNKLGDVLRVVLVLEPDISLQGALERLGLPTGHIQENEFSGTRITHGE